MLKAAVDAEALKRGASHEEAGRLHDELARGAPVLERLLADGLAGRFPAEEVDIWLHGKTLSLSLGHGSRFTRGGSSQFCYSLAWLGWALRKNKAMCFARSLICWWRRPLLRLRSDSLRHQRQLELFFGQPRPKILKAERKFISSPDGNLYLCYMNRFNPIRDFEDSKSHPKKEAWLLKEAK